MTKEVERLIRRLDGMAPSELPHWLTMVQDADLVATYKAIRRAYFGDALRERMLQFQKAAYAKHPNMNPLPFELELEREVAKLKANPWLRWREGLADDPVVEKITAELTGEERYHLANAIVAFDEVGAPPDAILTSPLTNLPAEQASVVEKVRSIVKKLGEPGS